MMEISITDHALENINQREISIDLIFDVIETPKYKIKQSDNRYILMEVYFDNLLAEEMLIRVVVEETQTGVTVITAYKTSKLNKYLKGLI